MRLYLPIFCAAIVSACVPTEPSRYGVGFQGIGHEGREAYYTPTDPAQYASPAPAYQPTPYQAAQPAPE